MRISHDDQYLFSVGDDGTLFIFRIFDKESRMIKREREAGYAEEVLITRTDLEEKVYSTYMYMYECSIVQCMYMYMYMHCTCV